MRTIQDITLDAIYDARCIHEQILIAYYQRGAISEYHAREAVQYFQRLEPIIAELKETIIWNSGANQEAEHVR